MLVIFGGLYIIDNCNRFFTCFSSRVSAHESFSLKHIRNISTSDVITPPKSRIVDSLGLFFSVFIQFSLVLIILIQQILNWVLIIPTPKGMDNY